MPSAVTLEVGGKAYSGWKSIQITRSVESLAGSFSLTVNDRRSGQSDPWPIVEEDPCKVLIDGDVVIDGFVDRREISFSATQTTTTVSGRDKSAALVDNSAVLDRWTIRRATVADIAAEVAGAFGIAVDVQPGLELLKAQPKLAISPGDRAFDVISKAAKSAGVMVVSNGKGGILITRANTTRVSSALIEGDSIIAGSVSYDAAGRYARYIVAGQQAGTDEASGNSTRVRAEATDEGVGRLDRVLMLRPAKSMPADYAKQRADYEARIRAARAATASVIVHGWRQLDGSLWPINSLVYVRSPRLEIEGDMRISEASHSLGPQGELTTLRLVRPDVFTPDPAATVRNSKAGGVG